MRIAKPRGAKRREGSPPEHPVITQARERLGIELHRDTLRQMTDAARLRRTRFLGAADGREQYLVRVDGRELYFLFDPAARRVCTVAAGPIDMPAERLRRKAALLARRAAGKRGKRDASVRSDPLRRFAMRKETARPLSSVLFRRKRHSRGLSAEAFRMALVEAHMPQAGRCAPSA